MEQSQINKKLVDLIIELADQIKQLKENQCGNSGYNWYCGEFQDLLNELK